MLIFVDTEFTHLQEAYLVSAGLATADGRELYFEIAGVSPAVCSAFTRETVLPLLDGPVLTPIQAAEQVAAFLAPYEKVAFFTDAPRYDVELLRPFLPNSLEWSYAVPSFENDEEEAAYQTAYDEAFASGLRRHHALDDARAACRAWMALQKHRGNLGHPLMMWTV
jgi:hypothetical protein